MAAEHEAIGHPAWQSAGKGQGLLMLSHFTPLSVFQSGIPVHEMVPPMFKVGLPSSFKPLKLTMRINYYKYIPCQLDTQIYAFFKLYLFCVIRVPLCAYGGQRTIFRNWFSFTMWGLGIPLRPSRLGSRCLSY